MSDEITDLLDGTVEEIVAKLPEATLEELGQLKEAEEKGKTRSSLMEALDAQIAVLSPDSAPEDDQESPEPDEGDGGAAKPEVADAEDVVRPVADTTAADLAQEKADKEPKPKPVKEKKVEPKTRKPKKGVAFRAVKQKIRNPHTGDVFNIAGFTEVVRIDSWLDCQMEAGLIIEVKIGEDK